jgi:O-antigen ligase
VVATRSRAGLGALALQAVGLVLFAAWRARGAVRWVALAAVVAAAVAGRGVLARYLERFSSGDVVARGDVYRATARMAADSPAVGWGMGTFEASFPAYQPDSALYHYAHAHCDPLEWVAGGGALGLALVVALAARGVVGARDRRASAWARALWFSAVAGCAAAACVEFPLQIPAVRFVWLGVLFAGPPRDRADVAPGSLPTAR